jgi:hypothetical protein
MIYFGKFAISEFARKRGTKPDLCANHPASLTPQGGARTRRLADLSTLPACQRGGGDSYDFHLLSEGLLGVVTGEATGKGVPAALMMSTTCGMLQAVSQTLDSTSPWEVLERINDTLLSRVSPNMFATCFYAILDPMSATLSYANAGHDLPLPVAWWLLRGAKG